MVKGGSAPQFRPFVSEFIDVHPPTTHFWTLQYRNTSSHLRLPGIAKIYERNTPIQTQNLNASSNCKARHTQELFVLSFCLQFCRECMFSARRLALPGPQSMIMGWGVPAEHQILSDTHKHTEGKCFKLTPASKRAFLKGRIKENAPNHVQPPNDAFLKD